MFRYFQKQLLLLRISRKGDTDPQKEEVLSVNYWVFHLFLMRKWSSQSLVWLLLKEHPHLLTMSLNCVYIIKLIVYTKWVKQFPLRNNKQLVWHPHSRKMVVLKCIRELDEFWCREKEQWFHLIIIKWLTLEIKRKSPFRQILYSLQTISLFPQCTLYL